MKQIGPRGEFNRGKVSPTGLHGGSQKAQCGQRGRRELETSGARLCKGVMVQGTLSSQIGQKIQDTQCLSGFSPPKTLPRPSGFCTNLGSSPLWLLTQGPPKPICTPNRPARTMVTVRMTSSRKWPSVIVDP